MRRDDLSEAPRAPRDRPETEPPKGEPHGTIVIQAYGDAEMPQVLLKPKKRHGARRRGPYIVSLIVLVAVIGIWLASFRGCVTSAGAAELQQPNWGRHGSCLYAAVLDVLRHNPGMSEAAKAFERRHGGGATFDKIDRIAARLGIPCQYCPDGNEAFLLACDARNLWAAIGWQGEDGSGTPDASTNGFHAVTFCGFDANQAIILDSNFPGRPIRIPRADFFARWHVAGGEAWTAVGR